MNIYDEVTHEILDPVVVEANVKNGNGYTYSGRIQTEVIPAHYEPTIGGEPGEQYLVPEQVLYEECLYYHAFTPDERKPTWQETIEAQVLYTAMMTDTLIEEG